MDGFADTVDALSSCQTRERKLEILKDPHTGAFAVIGCCLYTIYALDCELNLSANSMKGTFLRRAKGHIIQSGNVIGEFE